MTNPAKMHRPRRAGSDESDPTKKASAFVTEVIVIDGPACVKPSLNLSFADKWSSRLGTVLAKLAEHQGASLAGSQATAARQTAEPAWCENLLPGASAYSQQARGGITHSIRAPLATDAFQAPASDYIVAPPTSPNLATSDPPH